MSHHHNDPIVSPAPTLDGTSSDATREAGPTRRTVLTGAAALAAVGFVPSAAEAAGRRGKGGPRHHARITVLGTTDLHGNVFNWDYFKDAEYNDSAANDIGLAKISTLVSAVREDRGERTTLLIDAGDTIQGTPLAYYYAKIDPITEGSVHPMAEAMNIVGYDAAALGNHEFNYGIPLLRKFEEQLDFPLLGANALDAASKLPAFPPYVIRKLRVGDRVVKVGILGLTNPGIAIWDRAHVEGRMEFPGLVEQAEIYVPRMRKDGADVVVVSAHSGADTSSSYGDALPYPENAATLVAEQVPGIDAILVGHAHKEIVERWVTNEKTGKKVLLTEPLRWGMRLAVLTFDLEPTRSGWKVRSVGAQLLNANTVDEDPAVVAALSKQHDVVVDYVNSVIGRSLQPMSAARAVVEDVAAIDFVNHVQAEEVKAALAGTADAALPVLSIAAPFNRAAAIPEGDVTVRDVAGLYIYDNTLLAVRITGAQLRDYLEFSARYFEQVSGTGPFTMDEVTNAVTPTAPNGTPDYNYDIVGGLDAPLTYKIDLAKGPGEGRIVDLAYDGATVQDTQEFALAINNYRQSGGGNFPHVKDAPVLYNRQVEIRQLIIDWVTAQGVVDATEFASVDWKLVSGGADVTIS
ncbi:MAG TPA: 5'-nucleotidase C-terminal domain-containing protein [Nocardioidaceae bacterium]|nr:5'-nucleotidase C-terminal domain-containing protein [Nocardioidaceae bacterium]